MDVPSGRTLSSLDFVMLRLMVEYGFIRWSEEPVRFKSGVESHVYVGGRDDITDHPELGWFLGRKIANCVLEHAHVHQDSRQQCLIGIPVAGTTLAQAAALFDFTRWRNISLDAEEKPRIIHRVMRESQKRHGVHQTWVDGRPDPDHQTYWFLDNTVTDGGTKLVAREHCFEDGYPVQHMPTLIVVDRQQGGIKNMEQAGFPNIVVAYNLRDLTHAFGQLKLWPQDRVRAVEEEIEANQLV